jgi:membrane-bound ClpP family serine protease
MRGDLRQILRLARVILPGFLILVSLLASTGLGQAGGQQTPSADQPAPAAAPRPGSGPAGPTAVPAARQANNIAVITIRDEITQTTFRSVKRRIELASRAGADAIVFEIDTPGGDLYAVLGICTEIKSSPITNTVAWVNNRAYSGGAIIALACRETVTADPATMGDALPIAIGSFGQINQLQEHERQKFLSPLIAELVDSARRNNYDELLVQGIAARGVELWLVENTATGQELFITADEYRLLFGREPVRSNPSLPAAPSLPEATPGEGEQQPSEAQRLQRFPDPSQLRRPRAERATRARQQEDPNSPTRYIPAAPGMGEMGADVTMRQELPSQRPTLSEADRGNWQVVEYVSSGAGPFVFKADDLLRYDLATATVQNDEELKAFFGARNIIRLEPTWSEGLVAFLTWRPIQGLLVVVFLLALFIEMTSPGMGLPGTIAAVALIALLAPPVLINLASWWVVAAIIVGLLMLAIEVLLLPGMGVFGLLGLVLLFGGLVGLFVPESAFFPDSPSAQNDLLYGMVTLLLALTTSGILIFFVARHFGSLPLLNRLVLKDPGTFGDDDDDFAGNELLAAADPGAPLPLQAGMIGTAITTLRPVGRVEFGDRIVDVVATGGYIPQGAKVRIFSVSEFRIDVEPLGDADVPPRFGGLGEDRT